MPKVRLVESPMEEAEGMRRFVIFCPGCKHGHQFRTGPGQWSFNNDMERPTINPSLLVTGGGDPAYRCHSFVRDGMIQFLSDCSHPLRGQTVPLEGF